MLQMAWYYEFGCFKFGALILQYNRAKIYLLYSEVNQQVIKLLSPLKQNETCRFSICSEELMLLFILRYSSDSAQTWCWYQVALEKILPSGHTTGRVVNQRLNNMSTHSICLFPTLFQPKIVYSHTMVLQLSNTASKKLLNDPLTWLCLLSEMKVDLKTWRGQFGQTLSPGFLCDRVTFLSITYAEGVSPETGPWL